MSYVILSALQCGTRPTFDLADCFEVKFTATTLQTCRRGLVPRRHSGVRTQQQQQQHMHLWLGEVYQSVGKLWHVTPKGTRSRLCLRMLCSFSEVRLQSFQFIWADTHMYTCSVSACVHRINHPATIRQSSEFQWNMCCFTAQLSGCWYLDSTVVETLHEIALSCSTNWAEYTARDECD